MIWIALAAFLGGMATATLGWLGSNESFNTRKFSSSAIRAFTAALVFAIGHEALYGIGVIGVAIAFLAGAGVEVGGHRLAGALKKGKDGTKIRNHNCQV
ncbi:hypothetical protein M1O12_00430 [Dehalococcoidia bacterium]|nr:hypothetical protein [Dehalococcoidia bacterium]